MHRNPIILFLLKNLMKTLETVESLETMNLILGIDPGFKGALALYDITTGQPTYIFDMPLSAPRVLNPEARQSIDAATLAQRIETHSKNITLAVLEGVHAMPGQGVTSTFRFGEGFGIVQGILAALNIRVIMPRPSVWKMTMNVTADKGSSLRLVRSLYPDFTTKYFYRAKDDGRAEALLLALFGAKSLGFSHTGETKLHAIL